MLGASAAPAGPISSAGNAGKPAPTMAAARITINIGMTTVVRTALKL